MLKANELRIGNIICDSRGSRSILADDFDYVDNETGKLPYNPIPLTEDWLLKFGFEKLDRFFELDDIILLKAGSSYLYYYSNHTDKRTDVKYVHQLQNLYFALTGQELTIKELANA